MIEIIGTRPKIRQATKTGYVECEVGGVADMSYSTSKYRRGRCQGDPPGTIAPTLTANGCGFLIRFEDV